MGTENRVRKRYGCQLILGGGRQRSKRKGDTAVILNFLQNTQRVTPLAKRKEEKFGLRKRGDGKCSDFELKCIFSQDTRIMTRL